MKLGFIHPRLIPNRKVESKFGDYYESVLDIPLYFRLTNAKKFVTIRIAIIFGIEVTWVFNERSN